MSKLRVALVILLLLTSILASQVASASTTISPKNMGDALSIEKARVLLENIEKKLTSGTSDIGRMNQELSAYVKYMARQNIGNVTKAPGTNKTNSTVKPPSMRGYNVPMAGIGDAIKALGGTQVKVKAPVEIAKSIDMPVLAII